MAKRMKTGGRTKMDKEKRHKRKTLTLSPDGTEFLEQQPNQSKFVDDLLIRERDARRRPTPDN